MSCTASHLRLEAHVCHSKGLLIITLIADNFVQYIFFMSLSKESTPIGVILIVSKPFYYRMVEVNSG